MKEDKEGWEARNCQENKASWCMRRGTHRVCAEALQKKRYQQDGRRERRTRKEGTPARRIPHLLSSDLSRNLLVLKHFITQSSGDYLNLEKK